MNWCFLWTSLSICFIYWLTITEQCSPPQRWSPILPEKRAKKADIVLYGTVVSTTRVNQSSSKHERFYGVILQVHCIVKGPRIPKYIHVTGFSNFTGGLCVHTKAFLNRPYIIFVKRKVDNTNEFQVLELNLQKGAIHPGHKLSVLRNVMLLAGENASLPIGVKNDLKPGCPHFKRRFREPTSHRPCAKKHCRCKKKKRKHKKRKRLKSTTRPKKTSWDLNEVPTLPRTRRYSNVINFDDEVESFENTNSQSVEVLALRSNSRQFNLDWNMYLLTMCCLYWISSTLLPT